MSEQPPSFQPPGPPLQPPGPPLQPPPPPGPAGPPPGPPPYVPTGAPPPSQPPPPYAPTAYQPPPPGFDGAPAGNSGKAIASMVCGIIGLPFSCCCFPVGLILGGVALVLGIIGRREIAASGGVKGGGGMALAGLILGGVCIGLGVIAGIFSIISIMSGNTHSTFTPYIPTR